MLLAPLVLPPHPNKSGVSWSASCCCCSYELLCVLKRRQEQWRLERCWGTGNGECGDDYGGGLPQQRFSSFRAGSRLRRRNPPKRRTVPIPRTCQRSQRSVLSWTGWRPRWKRINVPTPVPTPPPSHTWHTLTPPSPAAKVVEEVDLAAEQLRGTKKWTNSRRHKCCRRCISLASNNCPTLLFVMRRGLRK